MDIRNTCLIVLFAILISHLVIAQESTDTTEFSAGTSATTGTSGPTGTSGSTGTSGPTGMSGSTAAPTTSTVSTNTTTPSTTRCKYPDAFPLFGDESCISRAAYAGIFLTSIILAGISFLMVIGLLIILCTRRSRSSGSSYAGDSESQSSNSNGSTIDSPQVKKRAAGTTPPDDTKPRRTNQAYSNKAGPITDTQTPPSASRAPYTDVKPVSKPATRDAQSKNVKPKEPESHEMTTRQPNKRPTNTPRPQPSSPQTAAHQNGPRGKSRNNNVSPDDDMLSSQF